jgi:CheY-like chemotaxis protein
MSAVAQFRPALESKGIAFSATLSDSELSVEGVPAQMDRVIHNLIRNAQRHLSHCSAARCVLTVGTSREDGEVVLEVADSGPPLSADEMERIWDPFAVTGDEADVSGFELAVAHSLVTAQGGSITVSSDADHGTVFRVTWRAPTDTPQPEISRGARSPGPLDVLVVEDEVTLRDLLSRYLELRGHAVVLADGGEQALRLAEQNTFDVVVSDVRMPGIGGPELVRRLRQQPSCAHTRFVLSTGDALFELDDLAREGVTGVRLVHKPYDVSRLANIIEGS